MHYDLNFGFQKVQFKYSPSHEVSERSKRGAEDQGLGLFSDQVFDDGLSEFLPIKKQKNQELRPTNQPQDAFDEQDPDFNDPGPISEPLSVSPEKTPLVSRIQMMNVFCHSNHTQKKNTNFIKFIIKSYFRQIQKISKQVTSYNDKQIKNNPNFNGQWLQGNKRVKKQIYQTGTNNLTRKNLMKLLDSGIEDYEQMERWNRYFLRNFLRNNEFVKKNIMKNSYMKNQLNKRQYMIASKVFQLRCCNKTLTNRHQTR